MYKQFIIYINAKPASTDQEAALEARKTLNREFPGVLLDHVKTLRLETVEGVLHFVVGFKSENLDELIPGNRSFSSYAIQIAV